MDINLYEEMNEKIADIIAIGGSNPDLYASAYIKQLRAEVKAFKDKLESGRLIELPCKVGEILYAIMDVDYKYQIVRFKATNIELGMYGEVYFNTPTCYSHKLTFGKSVFADKAQAEARLKELQEKL